MLKTIGYVLERYNGASGAWVIDKYVPNTSTTAEELRAIRKAVLPSARYHQCRVVALSQVLLPTMTSCFQEDVVWENGVWKDVITPSQDEYAQLRQLTG